MARVPTSTADCGFAEPSRRKAAYSYRLLGDIRPLSKFHKLRKRFCLLHARGLQNGVFSGSSCKIEISQEFYWSTPATAPVFLLHVKERTGAKLRFVYVGNVFDEENNTLCPCCGALLVRRADRLAETLALVPSQGSGLFLAARTAAAKLALFAERERISTFCPLPCQR